MSTNEQQPLPISAAIHACNAVRPPQGAKKSIQNDLLAVKFEHRCLQFEYYLKQRLNEANLKRASEYT